VEGGNVAFLFEDSTPKASQRVQINVGNKDITIAQEQQANNLPSWATIAV
jgi:hypothetical protein